MASLICVAPSGASAVGLGQHRVAPTATRPADHGLVAPATCPGQTDADAPVATQRAAMRCMIDVARRRAGLGALADSAALDRSAEAKARDILRCDSFSHFACGRAFTYWIKSVGYIPARCWRVGENLVWGAGEQRTVRSLFQALMRSPEHRANILGQYSAVGVGLRIGTLNGRPDTYVWTQHFGSHCGS